MKFSVGDEVVCWDDVLDVPKQISVIEDIQERDPYRQTALPEGYYITTVDVEGNSYRRFFYPEEVRAVTKLDKALR